MINNVVATETWKDIPGYEGYYKVSDKGRVLSLIGWNGHQYVKRKKIIKGWTQTTDEKGDYKRQMILLVKDGNRKECKIHRIVAGVFIPNPEDKPNVNHIDGNPLNNRLENLEWCTQKENVVHAIEIGLKTVEAYENKNNVIEMYENGCSIKEISDKYGAGNLTINKILEEADLEIRGPGFYKEKYFIDRQELVKDFEDGMRNIDIAKKHNTNRHLIGVYKYKHKRGLLL